MKNEKNTLKESEIKTTDVKADLINRRSALGQFGKLALTGATVSMALLLSSCVEDLPSPLRTDTADSDANDSADSD